MTAIERASQYFVWFMAGFTVIFLMTPLIVTVAVSFGSSTVFTLPPPDWSLRWYERLAGMRGLLPALVVSLQIAAVSTAVAMVLGAANIFLPFMILPIYSVVKLIDPRLSEAGATLGATPLYRFFHVTLPLTLPGIVSGVAFVFSMSVSMFVIPSLLIGDRFQTLSTLTGRSFLLMRTEQLGSTTAVILLVLAVSIVVGSTWLARRIGGSQT